MCKCKDKSCSILQEKYFKLYQENLKLKEAIEAIENTIGVKCKVLREDT
jgi:hypothetical protein